MTVLEKKRVFRMKPKPELALTSRGNLRPKKNRTTQWFQGVHMELINNPIGDVYNLGFINIFLSDHSREILHDEHLYYLFSPDKFTRDFDRFCNYIETLPSFTEMYDVRPVDMGKVMIVMELPENMKYVREHFIKGEYSAFPAEYMYTKMKSTLQFDIWSKNPDIRTELETKLGTKLAKNAELDSIPDMNMEVFNYNKEIEV